MNETSDESKTQICRLCLSATTTCFSLVQDFEAVAMLKSLTRMRISSNDKISTMMCEQCHQNLNLAFQIQQNFINAEKRYYQQNQIITENATLTNPSDLEESEIIKLEIIEEPSTEPNEKFSCDICGAARTSKAYLKLHQYRCHKRVKCTVCAKTMSTVKIKNHLEVHKNKGETKDASSPPKIFTCKECGKAKFSKEALTRHINGIHRKRTCQFCNQEMSRASLTRHIETHRARFPTSKKYICDICGKIQLTRDAFYKHKTNVHTKGTCSYCFKEFSKGSLKNHEDLHQKSVKMEDKPLEGSEYKCDICGTVKLTKTSYYKHKYDHVQAECPICGVIMGQTSLQKHIKRHNKTYVVCEFCGKSVDSLGMKSHIEHSHKDNTHHCKQCDAVYRQKQTLLEHEKKEHLGKADFICETCGKKFYKKISLRRHIECTHLKLKPYSCEFCNMAFYTSSQRTKHTRTHTDEKPYKCEICEVKFRKKISLRIHLQAKHDIVEELTVECDTCGKKFTSKLGLEVHKRKAC